MSKIPTTHHTRFTLAGGWGGRTCGVKNKMQMHVVRGMSLFLPFFVALMMMIIGGWSAGIWWCCVMVLVIKE
jgi:hypothetical protein